MVDYENGAPEARDPEVVSLFATLVYILKGEISSGVDTILIRLGLTTIGMIH